MSSHGQERARRADVIRLVARCLGRSVSGIEELEPGLGRRRFLRLHLTGDGPASVIARLEPSAESADRATAVPPEPALEPLLRFLAASDLPVPAYCGGDPEAGISLLEDLGPCSLEWAATRAPPARRRDLYRRACALVPRLQALRAEPGAIPAFGRRLDSALIESKARKFVEWTLPWGLSRPASPSERRTVQRAFAWIARECAAAPLRLAHRDLKAANLHLRTRPDGGEELVMIDLQGAFLAAPEYDLVCLLRDSHVRLPEAEVKTHLRRIRPQLPDAPEPETFARRFSLLTLIRVGKDVSHYLHAAHERGDPRYLPFVPTALHNLRAAARRASSWDPRLRELAELIHSLPTPTAAADLTGGLSQPTASAPVDEEDPPCAR